MSNVLRLSKKSFSWVLVAITICVSIGFLTLISVQNVSAEAVSLGDSESNDNITIQNYSAVYFVDQTMKRIPFFHEPNTTTSLKGNYNIIIVK